MRTPARAIIYKWARWLHVYISMATLLLVLFFALSGITLNHPDLAFGSKSVVHQASGTLPDDAISGTDIDFLTVSELMRNDYGVHGRVTDTYADETQGQLSFRAPGYAADVFIDVPGRTFTLTTEAQGWVSVINDLHRGKAGGGAWHWVIDVTGAFLAVVALTGLVLLLILKKIRPMGLLAVLGGSIVVLGLAVLAVR